MKKRRKEGGKNGEKYASFYRKLVLISYCKYFIYFGTLYIHVVIHEIFCWLKEVKDLFEFELIREAKEQFEQQGVNLANIVISEKGTFFYAPYTDCRVSQRICVTFKVAHLRRKIKTKSPNHINMNKWNY